MLPARTSLLLLPLALVPALACGPVPVAFDVPFEASGTIEGAGLLEVLLGQLGFEGLTGFDLSSSQEFENNNARKEDVTDVRLTFLTLAVTSPEGDTLDFMDFIAFDAEAPGEAKARVADKEIPDGVTTVDLDLVDLNLAPYIRAESMTLSTEVEGNRPAEDTGVLITANFRVIAEVEASDLGQLVASGDAP